MKVLHVLQSNKFSGAENVVCQIISMLVSKDINFVYCSRDGQIKDALIERKIKFNLVDNFSVSEIRRVINEEAPDIIHAHDMKASFYVALVCGNIPLISHVHNNNFDARGVSLKSIFYWYAAKKAKHIFWVSKSSFLGYRFHNKFKDKSTILYNVIDIDLLYKKMRLDNNVYSYDVIYLGRLTFQKNPERVIAILENVKKCIPSMKAAIVGTGDLSDKIEKMIKDRGLTNNIDYLGFQSNPYKLLHDSKVMIMASRWEGTPMCALEAMALGVPIVSTPTDGLNELIQNDKTGYLSDDNTFLVDKICHILSNDDLHKQLSVNSKKMASIMMDKEKYLEEIEKVYFN